MFNWQKTREPYPRSLLINPHPADPNDKSYWPQTSGKVILNAEHRETLNGEALAVKKYPDPPVSVLRSSSPLYLKKEGDWRGRVIEAVKAGAVIHRTGTDKEVEEFISRCSAEWLEHLAKRARNTHAE